VDGEFEATVDVVGAGIEVQHSSKTIGMLGKSEGKTLWTVRDDGTGDLEELRVDTLESSSPK
jgi:hypothetical protein